MTSRSNPLLDRTLPIPFDRIEPAHVGPAVEETLAWARRRIDEVAQGASADGGAAGRGAGSDADGGVGESAAGASGADVLAQLDAVADEVARTWAPVSHLANVDATPELREAHAAALPEIVRFGSRFFQHEGVFARLRALDGSPDRARMSPLERRHLDKTLRDFRRAGAELSAADKEQLEKVRVELSELGREFDENLLEETADFAKVVEDPRALAGLPASAVERAARLAREKGREGWLLALDMPSVDAVLKHAEDRSLRREIHAAYLGRCAGGEHDNRPLVSRMLELRRELAALLGYDGFPGYRLETAMARSGATVRGFLDELTDATRPFYERDAGELEAQAERFGLGRLEPWDVSFLVEKLRKERFDVDDETLRPWFPLNEVQAGLFEIAKRLFGLTVEEADNAGAWHPDVTCFHVRDETGLRLGSFYADWFPRETKRQGAWMDVLVSGGPRDGGFDPHVAFIGGNFNPPTAKSPALLSHREVQTLFHEFGHLLHQVASRVEISGRGGVNVAWDWVEVPSQIMENWTWRREALDLFARHHETGEALPAETLERLLAARRFMGGWNQMRQLSLANLDLQLHSDYDGDEPVMEFAARALRPFVPSDRFVKRHLLPSFAHLFGGGYASAYYSYLWSETLEADAFSRFESEGVLSPETGRAFLREVLSQGDRHDPETLFKTFVGRDPSPAALLRRNLGRTLAKYSSPVSTERDGQ